MQASQCHNIFRYFWGLLVPGAEVWQETSVTSIVGKEGGQSCGSGLCVVVAEFSNWQQPFPVVLSVVAECPQILLEGGIDSIHLSVRLWVEGCDEVA